MSLWFSFLAVFLIGVLTSMGAGRTHVPGCEVLLLIVRLGTATSNLPVTETPTDKTWSLAA